MEDKEEWKDVVGYEGLYQVSNLGRVKSIDRYVESTSRQGTPYQKFCKGKIIKHKLMPNGYRGINLSNGNRLIYTY